MRKTELITLRNEQVLKGVFSFDDAMDKAPAVIFHATGRKSSGARSRMRATWLGLCRF
jgi:hypothetical protein